MPKISALLLALAATSSASPEIQSGKLLDIGRVDVSQDVLLGSCRPVTLIFARGTGETGNLGLTVGPALALAMKNVFGVNNVAVQGVDYPADVVGATSGAADPKDAVGAKNMVLLAQKAVSTCGSTKLILSGYSQGAEQVHGALINLPNNAVAAVVTFGDPLRAQVFQNIDQAKVRVNCAPGDPVCDGQARIAAAHVSYTLNGDIGDSVGFVQKLVGPIAGNTPNANGNQPNANGSQNGRLTGNGRGSTGAGNNTANANGNRNGRLTGSARGSPSVGNNTANANGNRNGLLSSLRGSRNPKANGGNPANAASPSPNANAGASANAGNNGVVNGGAGIKASGGVLVSEGLAPPDTKGGQPQLGDGTLEPVGTGNTPAL